MPIRSLEVQFKEADGVNFPYVDIGHETHGRPSFRLWVSGRLITQLQDSDGKTYPILQFPVANAAIVRTEKGSLVLRPAQGSVVYNVFVRCGYRGNSCLEVLTPVSATTYTYYEYESPRGNLGVSSGALIVAPASEPLRIRWTCTGRLYGAPAQGVSILYPDGREEDIDGLPDGLEELDELEQLIE